MYNWGEFAASAPDFATAGRRLLYHPDHGEVALLATVNNRQEPQLAPVCPIFTTTGLYLLVGSNTPKRHHLEQHGHYALHAQVGASDEEWMVRGTCRHIVNPNEIATALEAITFDSFEPADPVFELLIDFALWVSWPRPGQSEKRRWRPSP